MLRWTGADPVYFIISLRLFTRFLPRFALMDSLDSLLNGSASPNYAIIVYEDDALVNAWSKSQRMFGA